MPRLIVSLITVSFMLMLVNCSATQTNIINKKYDSLPLVLAGEWSLEVENLQREPWMEMKLRFTTVKAESCIGGEWKLIDVLSEKSFLENDFQIDTELSYQIQQNNLVIGRNRVCDAYLRMEGAIDKQRATSGSLYTFGWETRDLGFFTLSADPD